MLSTSCRRNSVSRCSLQLGQLLHGGGACPRVLAYNDDFRSLRVFRGEGASPSCVGGKWRKVVSFLP
eukprot:scaffold16518_cov139-Skeletonema_marinoi.AAC.7